MPVSQIFGANSTNVQNSISSTPNDGVMGQDEFLNMLVAQLNYQDPMDPMDSQQFAAQLAQFTSVEQLVSINELLQESTNLQLMLNQSINNTMNAQLIGLEVEADNEIVLFDEGEATPIMYELPGSANSVTLTISDSDGNVVKTEELGSMPQGEHTYIWDGTNNLGGTAPEGEYTFEVSAVSAEGNELEVVQFIQGIITGIIYNDEGQAVLKIGDLPVYLPNVTALNQPSEP